MAQKVENRFSAATVLDPHPLGNVTNRHGRHVKLWLAVTKQNSSPEQTFFCCYPFSAISSAVVAMPFLHTNICRPNEDLCWSRAVFGGPSFFFLLISQTPQCAVKLSAVCCGGNRRRHDEQTCVVEAMIYVSNGVTSFSAQLETLNIRIGPAPFVKQMRAFGFGVIHPKWQTLKVFPPIREKSCRTCSHAFDLSDFSESYVWNVPEISWQWFPYQR